MVKNPSDSYLQSIYPVINANKLYLLEQTYPNIYLELGQYDGNKISLIPNPSNSNNYVRPIPFIYNNNVYISYINTAFKQQTAKLTGKTYSIISNPDNGSFIIHPAALYKNNLYGIYLNSSGKRQLAQFNGSTVTPIANPDNGNVRFIYQVYKNKLYFQYSNTHGVLQLASYDGNNFNFISNPSNPNLDSISPVSIIYNNDLCYQYESSPGIYQLAQFNGNTIKLIKNPDKGPGFFGYIGQVPEFGLTPIIWNNKLYINYKNKQHHHQLGQFDGNSLTLIPNPDFNHDTTNGYTGSPIIYKNQLYFQYTNDSGIVRLSYLDPNGFVASENSFAVNNKPVTNSINIIPNPAHSIITIKFVTDSEEKEKSLQVINSNGVVLIQQKLSDLQENNTKQLDVSKLQPGIYTLNIKSNRNLQTKQFVKE